MNRNKYLMFLLVLLTVFNACDEGGNHTEPVIKWNNGHHSESLNFRNSEEVEFSLSMTFDADAGIKNIRISEITYNGDNNVIKIKELSEPDGYSGKDFFEYTFSKVYKKSDFTNNNSRIDLKFEISDNDGQYAYAIYSLSKLPDEEGEVTTYSVYFNIKDGSGFDVTNAIVTFNESVNVENDYLFYNILPGTYRYVISKAEYSAATGLVTVVDHDVSVDIVLEYVGQEVKNVDIYK
ncbi:MAG: hypothetical protein LBQ22_06765 [Bacteroidales bacterium]|jgi:hypothetical protein|nr:hypothetical protein [Bacteroidales bacterium]